MFLSDKTMRLLMELDAPTEQKVALLNSMRADEEAAIPQKSAGALRTEKWRAKKASLAVTERHAVTEGDDVGEGVTPAVTASRTHEGAQVVTLSSSLRSEGKTPTLPSGASPKPKPARSRLVPDSWTPSEKLLADLAVMGFVPGEIERELANFRDHEFRDPKADFDRAFRRWMRQSRNFQPRKAHDRPDHATAKLDAKQANYERAWSGSERAARYRGEP